MALNLAQLQAQDEAWGKQYDAQQEQQAETQKPNAAQVLPSSVFHWMNGSGLGRATLSGIDSAVATADSMYDTPGMRKARDVVAGGITGAVNTADAVRSGVSSAVDNARATFGGNPQDQAVDDAISNDSSAAADRMRDLESPLKTPSPIWDHAKNAVLDFRDAVAVQDPTLADNLVQGAGQLAIPFMGYSRLLSGVSGLANAVMAGALTDSTALAPHDNRVADMLALGRQTEGKFGEVLRTLAPDGSALNAYINFLTDRTNETEAEGRFKNVLDGLGANLIMTPLLHSVGVVLKQGQGALRYLAENGVRNTLSDLAPPLKVGASAQEGKIVFHGTNAPPFPEFDPNRIGSGEGNDTFGHGGYFGEDEQTGRYYQDMLARRSGVTGAAVQDARRIVEQTGSAAEAYRNVTDDLASERDPALRSRLRQMADLIKSGNYTRGGGRLVEADVPDQHFDKMLDWDAPISEQPHLQQVFSEMKLGVKPEANGGYRLMINGQPARRFADATAARETAHTLSALQLGEDVNGGVVYTRLADALGSKKAASEFLSDHGIVGNKYFDQVSRGTGKGTRNIVLFPRFLKDAKIVGEK